jgi:hypothetical protein
MDMRTATFEAGEEKGEKRELARNTLVLCGLIKDHLSLV